MRKKFFFMRHGTTDWNDRNLCQGQLDVPLSPTGREEIVQLYPLLAKLTFSKIVSSPLRRALETSQVIQRHCPYPIEVIPDLQERGWGQLEGAPKSSIFHVEEEEAINPDYQTHPSIESRTQFKLRILSGINTALATETPLIVSHGRVFLVLTDLLGVQSTRQLRNAAIIECNPTSSGWECIAHTFP